MKHPRPWYRKQSVKIALLCALILGSTGVAFAKAPPVAPGLYRTATGSELYVGPENYVPDGPSYEILNPKNGHITHTVPANITPVTKIHEERRIVRAPEGPLGVSLWYAGSGPRSTVILIHGNDPETRDMGFLIPYFAANGTNVISYDQRGTGDSTGNWFLNGPPDRARDVEAIFDAFRGDAHINAKKVGLWAASNGGWTAPIVATQRPVAFMILKSAPAETLEENVLFESREQMLRHGYGESAIADALATWKALIAFVQDRGSAGAAKAAYAHASHQPWFGASLLLPLKFPIPPALKAGYRRLVTYDPAATLRRVKTPTLAVFGALDRNVDVPHATRTFAADFRASGMTDFTMRVYPQAGHVLKVSRTGYGGDYSKPERFVAGYPEIMLDWLRARGFLQAR